MTKLLKIAFLFLCVTGFAQSKVGTIDVDYIISQMPELSSVQKQIEDYGNGLDSNLLKKLAEYQTAIDKYKTDEVSLTINQKKGRQDSIIAMENDIQKFQQNGNQLIVLKQEEYLKPLYEKIGIALEKIAKAEGYTQVLMRNNDVVYIDNRYDLTLAVLKELGIEIKEEE
ncbi:MAG: OmpH family outer membrane protein [Bacteroidetes bacterium]|nr:MAG: OmpH family outer membrane protein [Bacteroidota bacterium]TDI74966.1 MAG: OmpH family outer membrane protein [Bacteroidota bacterium]TDI81545.1 MAG: OmpH family outer membrane protein [Bacteroidota bacterium]